MPQCCSRSAKTDTDVSGFQRKHALTCVAILTEAIGHRHVAPSKEWRFPEAILVVIILRHARQAVNVFGFLIQTMDAGGAHMKQQHGHWCYYAALKEI